MAICFPIPSLREIEDFVAISGNITLPSQDYQVAVATAEPAVQPSNPRKNKNTPINGMFLFLVAGMGFEPHDLQVMSFRVFELCYNKNALFSIT